MAEKSWTTAEEAEARDMLAAYSPDIAARRALATLDAERARHARELAERDAALRLAREALCYPDNGVHYCRGCDAKSSEWRHGVYCPIQRQRHAVDEARKAIDVALSSAPPQAKPTRCGSCGRFVCSGGDPCKLVVLEANILALWLCHIGTEGEPPTYPDMLNALAALLPPQAKPAAIHRDTCSRCFRPREEHDRSKFALDVAGCPCSHEWRTFEGKCVDCGATRADK